MTARDEFSETDETPVRAMGAQRFAYIKPTDVAEARKQGIIPEGIKLPDGVKLYVLHAVEGSVLGFTDAWASAYGAAVQNELTPLSVH